MDSSSPQDMYYIPFDKYHHCIDHLDMLSGKKNNLGNSNQQLYTHSKYWNNLGSNNHPDKPYKYWNNLDSNNHPDKHYKYWNNLDSNNHPDKP